MLKQRHHKKLNLVDILILQGEEEQGNYFKRLVFNFKVSLIVAIYTKKVDQKIFLIEEYS